MRMWWTIAVLMLVMTIGVWAADNGFPVRIAVMADPHIFPQSLNPSGEAFDRYVSNDRKLLAESEAILQRAVQDILIAEPDLVLIPGDLTKDAELESHLLMVSMLGLFKERGIPVYVVPGNHDVNNPHAFRYAGDQRFRVPTITASDFERIYADFGYNQAIRRDPHSLSYLVQPYPWLWILCIDSAIYEENKILGYPVVGGAIRPQTMEWILEILDQAKVEGIRVMAQLHHGVVAHFDSQPKVFPEFLLEDWEQVATLWADAGLSVVFTGHFHAQDVAMIETVQGNRLFDILTGSLVTFPNPWRMVEIASDFTIRITSYRIEEIDYDTKGMPFQQYSEEMLVQGLLKQTQWLATEFLVRMGTDPVEAAEMAKTMIQMRVMGLSIGEIAVDVLKRVLQGDQRPDLVSGLAAQLLSRSENPVFRDVGQMLMGLVYDDFPPDNHLTLCWNTLEVVD